MGVARPPQKVELLHYLLALPCMQLYLPGSIHGIGPDSLRDIGNVPSHTTLQVSPLKIGSQVGQDSYLFGV